MVRAVAGRRLRDLRDECLRVPQEQILKLPALPELFRRQGEKSRIVPMSDVDLLKNCLTE